jgi:hypothetical protein
MTARLKLLEDTLAARVQHASTPFDQIVTISNPGTITPTGYKVCQIWWETYRTIEREAVNRIIYLTQEIIFGTNIISSMSTEAAARQECYELAEELEIRLFPPFFLDLGATTSIIFPIHDIDASFTQMEGEGVFTLTLMWSFTWKIAKGG